METYRPAITLDGPTGVVRYVLTAPFDGNARPAVSAVHDKSTCGIFPAA
jgi:hypothetical protein